MCQLAHQVGGGCDSRYPADVQPPYQQLRIQRCSMLHLQRSEPFYIAALLALTFPDTKRKPKFRLVGYQQWDGTDERHRVLQSEIRWVKDEGDMGRTND